MSNDTQTLTLTDFLLARIAEDEAVATTALQPPAYDHYGDTAAEECWRMAKSEGCSADGYRFHRAYDPARVLAECEAKRRIIELRYSWNLQAERTPEPPFGPTLQTQVNTADAVLRTLALPYAEHPDYREEWRGDMPRCRCGKWRTYIGAYDSDGKTLRCHGCLKATAKCWCR